RRACISGVPAAPKLQVPSPFPKWNCATVPTTGPVSSPDGVPTCAGAGVRLEGAALTSRMARISPHTWQVWAHAVTAKQEKAATSAPRMLFGKVLDEVGGRQQHARRAERAVRARGSPPGESRGRCA